MTLCAKYPDTTLVPNESIDAMWHQHILDTRQYAKDSIAIFGEFLHHYPYFGADNRKAWLDAFEQTNQLYRVEFGEDGTEESYAELMTAAQSCK